jgi:hypothetical protein
MGWGLLLFAGGDLPVVTWLIIGWDWQVAFVVIAIAMTVCLVVSCLLIRNHPHEIGLQPYGADSVTVPPPSPASVLSRLKRHIKRQLRPAHPGESLCAIRVFGRWV